MHGAFCSFRIMGLQDSESTGSFSVRPMHSFAAANFQDSNRQSQLDIIITKGGGFLI